MKVIKPYLAFRRTYAPMLNAAKREMDTPMQRGLVDAIASTSFQAGFNAALGEESNQQPINLKPWKPTLPTTR